MILFGFNTVNEIPGALMAEIVLLNGVLSLFAAHYLRKFGFLAPVGITRLDRCGLACGVGTDGMLSPLPKTPHQRFSSQMAGIHATPEGKVNSPFLSKLAIQGLNLFFKITMETSRQLAIIDSS
jgi:hypothetical protein